MSNFRAVAAVTHTIKRRLEHVIGDLVPDAVVTTHRPEAEPHGIEKKLPRINLYLFQTTNNASFRNADTPTRNGDGALVQRPQVALDLNYILSFFGDDHLKDQLLLGLASSSLHTEPYLSPAEIRSATRGNPFQDSGLADQEVPVRIAPLGLTLQELTKFWSGFFQVPYTLSLAYQASVVLLDADLVPQAALPVQGGAAMHGGPGRLAQIFDLQPAAIELAPGAEVVLSGRNLGGAGGLVGFGDVLVTLPSGPEQARVSVALPSGLRAGTIGVRAGRTVRLGPAAEPRQLLTSNAVSLVVQPRIEGEVRFNPIDLTVTVPVVPEVHPGQIVQLLLNDVHQGQPSYSYSQVQEGRPTSRVTFAVPRVSTGNYLVQVVVDGAASRLRATDGRYSHPTVLVERLP